MGPGRSAKQRFPPRLNWIDPGYSSFFELLLVWMLARNGFTGWRSRRRDSIEGKEAEGMNRFHCPRFETQCGGSGNWFAFFRAPMTPNKPPIIRGQDLGSARRKAWQTLNFEL
jgi:hypothetical protein